MASITRELFVYIQGRLILETKKMLRNSLKNNNFDALIHLAGQVAVTSSIDNPREDLDTNIIGTFNLLESIRKYSPNTMMINASTNKVYGELENCDVIEDRFKL